MEELVYCTGNKHKFNAALSVLKDCGVELQQQIIEIDEIQSSDVQCVAINKAKAASKIVNKDIIVNDSAFCIKSLNDFPSTYAKYIEEVLSEDKILKLLEGEQNREAEFVDCLVYYKTNGDYKVFISSCLGTISTQVLGDDSYGYDKIFIPKGFCKTMAQMTEKERALVWQSQSLYDLKDYLIKNK